MGCGCGCVNMIGCASTEDLRMATSMGLIGSTVAPECDEPLGAPSWPSSVDALKLRIGVVMTATEIGVKACAGLSSEDRQAWSAFYATWQAFAATPTPIFGSGNAWMTACGYSRELSAWQETLRAKCTIPGPTNVPKNEAASDLLSIVRWGAIGVVSLAIVYGVSKVLG
jgi:hypothetical protein